MYYLLLLKLWRIENMKRMNGLSMIYNTNAILLSIIFVLNTFTSAVWFDLISINTHVLYL